MKILSLNKKNIIPVDYELGYIMGILLARRYLQAYVRQQESVLFDEQYVGGSFLSYLHIFNTRNTVFYQHGTFVLNGDLYQHIKQLIQYINTRMATDYEICQSQSFVKGIRDVFLKPDTEFSHQKFQVMEYIQKNLWYWFELNTQMTIQTRPRCRKKYVLKSST
jgi:hypothetical protein